MGGVCEGDFASANDRLDRPTTHNMSMRIQSARSTASHSVSIFDSYEQPIHLWDSLYVTLLETEERVRSKSILKVPGGTLLGQYTLATTSQNASEIYSAS